MIFFPSLTGGASNLRRCRDVVVSNDMFSDLICLTAADILAATDATNTEDREICTIMESKRIRLVECMSRRVLA